MLPRTFKEEKGVGGGPLLFCYMETAMIALIPILAFGVLLFLWWAGSAAAALIRIDLDLARDPLDLPYGTCSM